MKSAIRPLSILLAVLFLLSGCNQSAPQKKGAAKGPAIKITYRLKWLFNASTAGDLWARDRGIFRENGLDVTVKEGGAEQDAIEELELGRAQFGVASADQVLRAVSRGADVLVLAQIFQVNPLQWIYMKSRVDLKGHSKQQLRRDLTRLTIGITYGGNDEAIFMALAKSLGLDPDHLHIYAITYDYAPFWKKEVDLWPCYRNTQGITLSEKMEAMGDRPGFLNPADYGINFVANSLITSRKFASRHLETVKTFTRCVLTGWKEALKDGNRQAMARILLRYEKTLSTKTIIRQIEATKGLVTAGGQRQIGFIDMPAWHQTERVMYEQRLIKKRVAVQDILSTTRFLDRQPGPH